MDKNSTAAGKTERASEREREREREREKKKEEKGGGGDSSRTVEAADLGKALHPFFRAVCRFAPQAPEVLGHKFNSTCFLFPGADATDLIYIGTIIPRTIGWIEQGFHAISLLHYLLFLPLARHIGAR